jgi:hypothetical protein
MNPCRVPGSSRVESGRVGSGRLRRAGSRIAAQRASEKTSLPADSPRILSRNSSSWGSPAVVGWTLMGEKHVRNAAEPKVLQFGETHSLSASLSLKKTQFEIFSRWKRGRGAMCTQRGFFLSFFTDTCARSSTMAQNYAAVWWKMEGVHLFSAVFLSLHCLFFL